MMRFLRSRTTTKVKVKVDRIILLFLHLGRFAIAWRMILVGIQVDYAILWLGWLRLG